MEKDIIINTDKINVEYAQCDWFAHFMKTVVKDLNKRGSAYVYFDYQVDFLRKLYGDILDIEFIDNIFYVKLPKQNTHKQLQGKCA